MFCINVIICIYIYIYLIRQKRNHDGCSAKKYKGRNDSKQNGMDLLRRHFEMRPVSDKLWATADVMHLVNYILINVNKFLFLVYYLANT